MTVDEFLALFALEEAGADRFVGCSPDNGWRRVFGGQVLAQALLAAERTVAGRSPHSLHAYFLLGGDPHEPIFFEVERLRDGRSFTTRRVVARQKGEAIFTMVASFHEAEPGLNHAATAPSVPLPDACIDPRAEAEGVGDPALRTAARMLNTIWPVEHRTPRNELETERTVRDPVQMLWTRIAAQLPEDAALHRALILYMSDYAMLSTALGPHGRRIQDTDLQVASLDHALWFHRPGRADDWLLYAFDSPNASGATGLVRGAIYASDGRLLASVAQEGLLRVRSSASS